MMNGLLFWHRDLLAGVEHLRVMASSLDNMERIEELRPKRDKEK